VDYCLPKLKFLKTEAVSSKEVVSSRFQTVEYCFPKLEFLKIEDVSSKEVVSP
jgi:hypothetical protein